MPLINRVLRTKALQRFKPLEVLKAEGAIFGPRHLLLRSFGTNDGAIAIDDVLLQLMGEHAWSRVQQDLARNLPNMLVEASGLQGS